jgi:hypothetical protein
MARKKKQQESEDQVRLGHNKPELTEDENRVLIYQHKAAYQVAKKAVDDARAELLRVCKLAKSECGKSAVVDIKDLILLEQPKGEDALRADIERQLRLARWANAKVGTQFSFDEIDKTPDVDRAYQLGKTAGLKGEVKRPPFDASVPQYARWMDGWNDGQAVLVSSFRDKLKTFDDDGNSEIGGNQMDLSDRADLPSADLSDPPFALPPDMPSPPMQPA